MENNIKVYLKADSIISSLGFGTEENLAAIRSYRSGVSHQENQEIADTPLLAAMINTERLQALAEQKQLTSYTKLEQLFILSIQAVLDESDCSLQNDDCALILSTTKGNVELLHQQTEKLDEKVFLWKMAERIAQYFEAKNQVQIVSNACISGVSASIIAKRLIETGKYKNIIVAGGDVLSHFITSGFLSFKSLSENICKPYDTERDGLNLGEACAALLLSDTGTDEDIILSGGAISNDANHISGPSRTGDGLFLAMQQAMNEAEISPHEISFVNTHGTATVFNDEMEAKAIHLAKLETKIVNSLKPYFGHTLGASGLVETIICAHELKENTVFATLGYDAAGVTQPILVQASHETISMKSCIKTASGFGGCNAAIVLTLPGYTKKTATLAPIRTVLKSAVSIEKGEVIFNEQSIHKSEETEFPLFIRELYKKFCQANMKFFKMDDLCKLGYVAAELLLKDETYAPQEIGIILSNAASSLHADSKHQQVIDKGGDSEASPALFVYTLPNLVLGELCIRHKTQAENTFFISQNYDANSLEQYAQIAMSKGNLKACILGWCELLNNHYQAYFKLIEKK